jgi:peptidyl-prolyl cis-trans isomerase C
MRAVVAGAAALAGLASAGAQPPAPAPPGQPVAVVNGEPIAYAELQAILRQQGLARASLAPDDLRKVQRLAVEALVDNLLVQQFLRQHGQAPQPGEIDRQLANLEDGLKKQGQTLQDFYRATGQGEAEFRRVLANLMRWGDYVKAHVTEADLRRYYADNKDLFDGVLVRASHIVRRIPPGATESDRQQLRDFLLTLRRYILQGNLDFADAARNYSECPSAARGGDLGTFPRRFVVEEPFARAASALKVGEVSDVVQTSYGLHLIKVTERRPGKPTDYAAVHDQVRDAFIRELREDLIDRQRRTAKIEILVP